MNEIFKTIAAIPAITVLCLLGAQFYKALIPLDNRHIPLVCGMLGLMLGLLCHFICPGYLPAENFFVAAAIGTVSGWSATGINQLYRQEKSA